MMARVLDQGRGNERTNPISHPGLELAYALPAQPFRHAYLHPCSVQLRYQSRVYLGLINTFWPITLIRPRSPAHGNNYQDFCYARLSVLNCPATAPV